MIFTGKYVTGICPSRNKSVQDTFLMKNSKIVWDGGIVGDYFLHYNLFGSRVLSLGVQWCVQMTLWYGIFKQKKSEQWGKQNLLCRCNGGYGNEFLHCLREKKHSCLLCPLVLFHLGHSWSCSPVQALFQSYCMILDLISRQVCEWRLWMAPASLVGVKIQDSVCGMTQG